jgi:hypothetical protein
MKYVELKRHWRVVVGAVCDQPNGGDLVVRQGDVVNARRNMKRNPEAEKQSPYATRSDFCHIFEEKMNSLYLLSFLLTADHSKAKRCFVAGLDSAADSPPVFRDWANSWARRAIIQSAIRLAGFGSAAENGTWHVVPSDVREGTLPTEQPQIIAILELPALERFVFVLSVLEGYSIQECSLLLGCTRREAIAAQIRAFEQIGLAIQSCEGHRRDEPSPAKHERVFQ